MPIIKTKIQGVAIDFLVARLNLASIPDDLSLRDDNLSKNLDDRCVRSLNGAITHELFREVQSTDTFQVPVLSMKFCDSYPM